VRENEREREGKREQKVTNTYTPHPAAFSRDDNSTGKTAKTKSKKGQKKEEEIKNQGKPKPEKGGKTPTNEENVKGISDHR